MKRFLMYLVCLIVGFILGYQATLHFYPNLLFVGANKKIGSAPNEVRYSELPDESSRFVVKPNPDFLYATCFYDLSDGPLRVTGDLPDSTYWSISMYEPNTVNFYVKNDQQFSSDKLDLILSSPGDAVPSNDEDFEMVESPSRSGLILFRLLVTDHSEEEIAKYKKIQQSIRVELFNN